MAVSLLSALSLIVFTWPDILTTGSSHNKGASKILGVSTGIYFNRYNLHFYERILISVIDVRNTSLAK